MPTGGPDKFWRFKLKKQLAECIGEIARTQSAAHADRHAPVGKLITDEEHADQTVRFVRSYPVYNTRHRLCEGAPKEACFVVQSATVTF